MDRVFPIPDESTEAMAKALRTFPAPGEKVLKVWGDGSGEIVGACGVLEWPLQQSTLGRQRVAERAVRAGLAGTRAVLEQSGLEKWWSRAARHFTLVYKCTAHGEHGTTAWSRRFKLRPGIPLDSLRILGSLQTETK